MTRTRHLPLYAATYSFAKDVYRVKIKLPKVLKFDLGQEAFSSAIKMLKCVVVANASKDKVQMLYDFNGNNGNVGYVNRGSSYGAVRCVVGR